ncbi:hypothetical protein FKM82_019523 [Ascaphus truei]
MTSSGARLGRRGASRWCGTSPDAILWRSPGSRGAKKIHVGRNGLTRRHLEGSLELEAMRAMALRGIPESALRGPAFAVAFLRRLWFGAVPVTGRRLQ